MLIFICLASTVNILAISLSDEEQIKSSKITNIGSPETAALISLTILGLSSLKLTPNDSK